MNAKKEKKERKKISSFIKIEKSLFRKIKLGSYVEIQKKKEEIKMKAGYLFIKMKINLYKEKKNLGKKIEICRKNERKNKEIHKNKENVKEKIWIFIERKKE